MTPFHPTVLPSYLRLTDFQNIPLNPINKPAKNNFLSIFALKPRKSRLPPPKSALLHSLFNIPNVKNTDTSTFNHSTPSLEKRG